jgi:hypothetical protein
MVIFIHILKKSEYKFYDYLLMYIYNFKRSLGEKDEYNKKNI